MKNMGKFVAIIGLAFVGLGISCNSHSSTEKIRPKENVENVTEKVVEIIIEDPLIGSRSLLYIIDKYLIIKDFESNGEMIHLFDLDNFKHVASTAPLGQGPGEFANIGHIGLDETNRRIFVTDHGKQRIFSYELDSILSNNPLYVPQVKMVMNERKFPSRYYYVSDTVSYGLVVEPMRIYGFIQSTGKWNMVTGEVEIMGYTHPDIAKKRVSLALSMENKRYVECHSYYDLMSICNLDGGLICNIYGSNKKVQSATGVGYYDDVLFCGDYIVAKYLGEKAFDVKDSGEIKGNLSTRVLVFDVEGNYIKSLEIGHEIIDICYDRTHNRLIMGFDDEMQFAYLDLDGVI